jgi:hypothetical protein
MDGMRNLLHSTLLLHNRQQPPKPMAAPWGFVKSWSNHMDNHLMPRPPVDQLQDTGLHSPRQCLRQPLAGYAVKYPHP